MPTDAFPPHPSVMSSMYVVFKWHEWVFKAHLQHLFHNGSNDFCVNCLLTISESQTPVYALTAQSCRHVHRYCWLNGCLQRPWTRCWLLSRDSSRPASPHRKQQQPKGTHRSRPRMVCHPSCGFTAVCRYLLFYIHNCQTACSHICMTVCH